MNILLKSHQFNLQCLPFEFNQKPLYSSHLLPLIASSIFPPEDLQIHLTEFLHLNPPNNAQKNIHLQLLDLKTVLLLRSSQLFQQLQRTKRCGSCVCTVPRCSQAMQSRNAVRPQTKAADSVAKLQFRVFLFLVSRDQASHPEIIFSFGIETIQESK